MAREGDTSALAVTGMSVAYGRVTVVREVTFEVAPGEHLCILGRNGAGKTTALHGIAGLLPRAGQVTIGGRIVPPARPDVCVRYGMALVPQGRYLFPAMSVEDNILLGMYQVHRRRRHARSDDAFDMVLETFPPLAERLRQQAGSLSGGEQQMLAVGRALTSRPQVLVLDEPSLGLSPRASDELYRCLAQLATTVALTLVVVEESPNRALSIATRGLVMDRGRITVSLDEGQLKREVVERYLLDDQAATGAAVGSQSRDVLSSQLGPKE